MEFEKLKAILTEVMGIDGAEIHPETTFVDDLGADSLDIFEMLVRIEEEYDIEFDTDAADQIQTVGDAAEAIRNAVR